MPPRDTALGRRSSRKKGVSSLEARRRPKTTSGPKLGAYGRKHPKPILTPGHKRILREKIYREKAVPASTQALKNANVPRASGRSFLAFCIKHILTSGSLVVKERTYWHLREEVAGVHYGEPFTSLDACVDSIISSLEAQYSRSKMQSRIAA